MKSKTPKIGCIVATLCFVAFFLVSYYEFLSHAHVQPKLGYVKGGALSLLLLCMALMASDFTWRITSDHYSFKNLWIHYVSLGFLRLLAAIFYRRLIKDTKNAAAVQEVMLRALLKRNADSRYGKDHKFNEIHDIKQFQEMHPLTKYTHYEPYIDAIHAGEKGVMSPDEPYVLAMTSGTSGQPKMLPTYKAQRTQFFLYGLLPIFHVLFNQMNGMENLQKKLKFFYTPKWRQSPAGIPIGPNSSSPQNSQAELSLHSTPAAAFDIMSEPEALYVYLLFGIRDKKLGYLEANFASLIYTAFVRLESEWRQLVCDIRTGSISDTLNIDSEIRRKLESQLSPDPERADELETEFERGFLGIAKKIWPYMNFILTVDSGSFKVYGDLLRSSYCKGLMIYSPIYAATEGMIAMNIWPQEIHEVVTERYYVLIPRCIFYEFIPIEQSTEENPSTLLLHQLNVDEIYEMVITNSSGLYRYRFGDVVKVVGFVNQTPQVQFMYRQGQLLNVRGEKTSEKLFYDSFHEGFRTALPEGCTLVDYCCAEQLATKDEVTPGYLLFVELGGDYQPTKDDITNLQSQVDDNLQKSYIYKSFRVKGSIAPLIVNQVKPGTFLQFRLSMIESEKATPNQFKVPRVLKKTQAVEFMQQRCISLSS